MPGKVWLSVGGIAQHACILSTYGVRELNFSRPTGRAGGEEVLKAWSGRSNGGERGQNDSEE